MYRRKIERKLLVPSHSAVASRPSKVVETQNNQENEKENDEVIPSSQNDDVSQINQTQYRFKSQRVALINKIQEENNKGKSHLEIILSNCRLKFTEIGCELVDGKDDPLSFTRRFRSFLTSINYSQSNRNDNYMQEFKKIFVLSDESKLNKSMHFMQGIFVKDGENKYQTQATTLIMCLLSIDCFKNELPKILLQRLKEYVIEKGENADRNVIGLVLTQFKFSEQFLDDDTYDFMFEELFDILQNCKKFEHREVIVHHFRELSVQKQKEAAQRLYSLYDKNKTELLKFVNIFCDMALDINLAEQIFLIIQEYIEKDCSVSHYPAMLKYSQYYAQSSIEIVNMLRYRIKWEACSKEIIDEMFKLIDNSIKRDSKKSIETWLTEISEVRRNDDLKLIDFLILLSIADTNTEAQQRNVKKILLDQISKGLFSENYLKKSFKIFSKVIVENSQTLLELLDALQKTRENQLMYNFLATCYKLAFRYSNEVKPIIGSLVNFLCEKKAQLPFSSASEFKITILTILNDIKNDKITSAASLLMNYKLLLRVLDLWKTELTFNEHRLFIQFLCSLVYKVDYSKHYKNVQLNYIHENKDTLRDHLNMIVVKHINNPDEKIKQLGIIGAVKIVSALVVDSLSDSQLTENQTVTLDMIPKGPIKEAADLVDLMLIAANDNQEILSIFYDELSYEFKPREGISINQMFLNWLGDIGIHKLESLVTLSIESELPEFNGVTMENMYEIFDDMYERCDLAVKLGILVFEKSKDVAIIPSLFKLTRCINLLRFGNVDFMAGLVSMPITLPQKFATDADCLDDDEDIAKLQLDLYFYTCNWLREIIGGFLQATEDDFIKQVMKRRLKQLIKIENHLDVLLKKAPSSYLPPFMDFLQNEHKKKIFENLLKNKERKAVVKPPPAKKSKKKVNETELQETSVVVAEPAVLIKSNQFCREMDNDVSLLLNENFKLSTSQSDDNEFTLTELIYLLEDVHDKFAKIFKGHRVDSKGFANEIKSIKDIKEHLMPYLVPTFSKINIEIEEMARNSMETDDEEAAFFTVEGILIKKAFETIVKIFNIVYSSKKLKLDDNSELLLEMLKMLLDKKSPHLRSQDVICSAIIEQYLNYENNVRDINGAVILIDFMTTINSFTKDKMNAVKIGELAERFLKIRWKNANRQLENGSLLNLSMEKLLKIYVKRASNLEHIEKLIEEIEEITARNELLTNRVFPCITKANLICMLRIYIQRFSEIINASKSSNMSFEFWVKCTKLEEKFIAIVKCIKSMVAFNLFLKNFIVYLKKFNSDGMSILSEMARGDCQKFIQLVKDIQRIRRSAHGVACELKHRKNGGIAAILPTARQQFETFYHSAAKIAKQSKISSDYLSAGTLKNFNLDGEDIFSQNTVTSQNESNRQDNEIEFNDENEEDTTDVEDIDDDEDYDGGKKKSKKNKNNEVQQSSFRSRSTIL